MKWRLDNRAVVWPRGQSMTNSVTETHNRRPGPDTLPPHRTDRRGMVHRRCPRTVYDRGRGRLVPCSGTSPGTLSFTRVVRFTERPTLILEIFARVTDAPQRLLYSPQCRSLRSTHSDFSRIYPYVPRRTVPLSLPFLSPPAHRRVSRPPTSDTVSSRAPPALPPYALAFPQRTTLHSRTTPPTPCPPARRVRLPPSRLARSPLRSQRPRRLRLRPLARRFRLARLVFVSFATYPPLPASPFPSRTRAPRRVPFFPIPSRVPTLIFFAAARTLFPRPHRFEDPPLRVPRFDLSAGREDRAILSSLQWLEIRVPWRIAIVVSPSSSA
jgi:hypothetical protein